MILFEFQEITINIKENDAMINVNHKDFFNLLSVVNMDLLGIVTKASEVKKKHKIKRNI